jgi:hypothetical protein
VRHYDRYDYLPERRAAMAKWAACLDLIIAGKFDELERDNVVPFASISAPQLLSRIAARMPARSALAPRLRFPVQGERLQQPAAHDQPRSVRWHMRLQLQRNIQDRVRICGFKDVAILGRDPIRSAPPPGNPPRCRCDRGAA